MCFRPRDTHTHQSPSREPRGTPGRQRQSQRKSSPVNLADSHHDKVGRTLSISNRISNTWKRVKSRCSRNRPKLDIKNAPPNHSEHASNHCPNQNRNRDRNAFSDSLPEGTSPHQNKPQSPSTEIPQPLQISAFNRRVNRINAKATDAIRKGRRVRFYLPASEDGESLVVEACENHNLHANAFPQHSENLDHSHQQSRCSLPPNAVAEDAVLSGGEGQSQEKHQRTIHEQSDITTRDSTVSAPNSASCSQSPNVVKSCEPPSEVELHVLDISTVKGDFAIDTCSPVETQNSSIYTFLQTGAIERGCGLKLDSEQIIANPSLIPPSTSVKLGVEASHGVPRDLVCEGSATTTIGIVCVQRDAVASRQVVPSRGWGLINYISARPIMSVPAIEKITFPLTSSTPLTICTVEPQNCTMFGQSKPLLKWHDDSIDDCEFSFSAFNSQDEDDSQKKNKTSGPIALSKKQSSSTENEKSFVSLSRSASRQKRRARRFHWYFMAFRDMDELKNNTDDQNTDDHSTDDHSTNDHNTEHRHVKLSERFRPYFEKFTPPSSSSNLSLRNTRASKS